MLWHPRESLLTPHIWLSAWYTKPSLWFHSCQFQILTFSDKSPPKSVIIAQWENECFSLSVLSLAQVMIAEWENECIPLSVLSVAQVMIAQWENECISLSVISMARALIAQWENECISLSVLYVAKVMMAQWENECISLIALFVARVQFPATLTDHTRVQAESLLMTHPGKRWVKDWVGRFLHHSWQLICQGDKNKKQ